MRPFLARVLCPALLFTTLVAAWCIALRNQVPPSPRFMVNAGPVRKDHTGYKQATGACCRLAAVSDDGTRVTMVQDHYSRRFPSTHPELWDVRAKSNVTPAHWRSHEFRLLTGGLRSNPDGSGFNGMLANPGGRAFLEDEGAWKSFSNRMQQLGSGENSELLTGWLVRDYFHDRWPWSTYLSPNGELLAYVSWHGSPLNFRWREPVADGITIEEWRTGRRVAFLPGAKDRVRIALDGRTALADGKLWDLKTSTALAKLASPDDSYVTEFNFTADGRFVFRKAPYLWFSNVHTSIQWWDAATGRQIGEVKTPHSAFLDSGRVLVTHDPATRATPGGPLQESYVLRYWDMASRESPVVWNLDAPADGSGLYWGPTDSGTDRLLAMPFRPNYGRGPTLRDRIAAWVDQPALADRHEVVVLDAVDRREVARLPGGSPALSANGRWLATLSESGVIRVWDLPASQPWGPILAYADGAALASLGVILMVTRVLSALRRSRAAELVWQFHRTRTTSRT